MGPNGWTAVADKLEEISNKALEDASQSTNREYMEFEYIRSTILNDMAAALRHGVASEKAIFNNSFVPLTNTPTGKPFAKAKVSAKNK